jgi:hypothetical protein
MGNNFTFLVDVEVTEVAAIHAKHIGPDTGARTLLKLQWTHAALENTSKE